MDKISVCQSHLSISMHSFRRHDYKEKQEERKEIVWPVMANLVNERDAGMRRISQIYKNEGSNLVMRGIGGLLEGANSTFRGASRNPPTEPPPEPEKKRPPIEPPKRDPKPEPIKDPLHPPLPGKKPSKEPNPIGDPPDQSDQPIRMEGFMSIIMLKSFSRNGPEALNRSGKTGAVRTGDTKWVATTSEC